MAKVKVTEYEGKRLHLVDVSAVARTKWWNFKELSWVVDGKKVGTGALFAVLSLLKEIPLTDNILFCFDFGGNSRKSEYGGYKENRQSADSDYYVQINKLRDILVSCGFEILGQEGYEADDFIVGAAEYYKDKYDYIFLYSNDMDLTQLVDEKVIYKSIRSNQSDITIKNYEKELKIPYNTVVLYKATVGDASDNIKGIPRFGAKKFEKFIKEVAKEYDLKTIRKEGLEREIINNYKGFKDDERQCALESLNVVLHRLPNNYHFEETFEKEINKDLLMWNLNRYGMKSIVQKLTEQGFSSRSPYF